MSGSKTVKMIREYYQTAQATRYFSAMFQTPSENFYRSQAVEIDIVREDEDVATVVTNMTEGGNLSADELYTNKEFTAPYYEEGTPLDVFKLMNRQAGKTPFEDPAFQATANAKALRSARKDERKIRRAIELQAAEILQTGKLSLKNKAGQVAYVLDFKPKASHFPTAGTAWDQAGADPMGDLLGLAKKCREDGLANPKRFTFGEDAWLKFVARDDVQKVLDNRRINLGEVVSAREDEGGGIYHGTYEIGNYKFEMYTYNGMYKDPVTGAKTRYMDPGKVVVNDPNARMDLTFGAVPRIIPPDSRVLPFLPSRMSSPGAGMDMFMYAYVNKTGTNLVVTVSSRPLCIPTAIDTFGCLETGI